VTIITNTFQTFQSIGNREELSDIIYNISPTECPVMSNAGRGKVDAVLFEWQTDALATAVSTNQQIQGDDVTSFDSVTPTVRLGNFTEIARKTLIVSRTQQSIQKAGRKNEYNYQVAKKGKEIKRDMETSLTANKGASAGSSAVAPKTGSLLAFIKTNINKASDGTAPVYTSQPTDVWTNGTQRGWTETILKDLAQQAFTSGAEPKTLMVGALAKQITSGFAGVVELNSPQSKSGQATIIGAADTYISDFGKISVVPNRFSRARDAFLLDWEYVEIDYLDSFRVEPLAKTGDADKAMLVAEYGLRVGNEKALAVAVDLTP
jgi:hypothetical protein